MPVGDSITAGTSSGADNPSDPLDPSLWTSYRRDLWLDLSYAGHYVELVGSQRGGVFFDDFDPRHEGHPGRTDDYIADHIQAWVSAWQPDIVLLHIGTNGLASSPSDVERILNEIDAYSPDIIVILARIINRACQNPSCLDEVALTTMFNNNVQAMAEARIARGDKLILVDQERGAGLNYTLYPAGDMWDKLHPFETGYRKMAGVWFAALHPLLSVCAPRAPRFTSKPVRDALIDRLFRYSALARGIPSPRYFLESSPDGMTIDPITGEITWTPRSIGPSSVTVVAENASGRRAQRFTIHVSDCTVLTQHPANVTAVEGRSATFRVRARGPRGVKLSYQWFRNGVIIDGATRPGYTISRVTAADHGARFACIVSGGECPGVQSNPGILTVTSSTRP
jgi:lysophospholipase L1-like esterase